jgi:hypothetical protein
MPTTVGAVMLLEPLRGLGLLFAWATRVVGVWWMVGFLEAPLPTRTVVSGMGRKTSALPDDPPMTVGATAGMDMPLAPERDRVIDLPLAERARVGIEMERPASPSSSDMTKT